MPSFSSISALAVGISAVLARPHSASAGQDVHSHREGASANIPATSVHSAVGPVGTEMHAADKDRPTRAKTHLSPSTTAGGDLLSTLLDEFSTLNDRDVDAAGSNSSGDCSTVATVTTKLQVTVTVTADSRNAEETASLAEQKVVYTTTASNMSSTRRRHQHTGTASHARPHGTSVSGSQASSIIKPSSGASSSQAVSSPVTSLAAVQTSIASTQAAADTYALPFVLSEYVSPAKQSTSLFAVHTSSVHSSTSSTLTTIPTTSVHSTTRSTTSLTQSSTVHSTTTATSATSSYLTSAADKGSLPSFTLPLVFTTLATSARTSATPSSTYSSGKGKRGLAYNDAGLTAGFASSSQISWAYNWGSSTSGLADGLKYIPTLWSNTASFTKGWQSNAQKAIASGSTHLFSFNEPDLSSQANLTPEVAAAAYKTYLHDMFGGGSTKLCAPAITNGGGSMGLTWLTNFMAACPSCQIDCINLHWYGDSESDLEQHITDAMAVADGKEIWISEFALNGSPSSATVQTFLEQAMAFLDKTEAVTGYAYFMASQGRLVDGSSPSNPVGTTYMG